MARIHWLDILIAPLTLLERTRGRRRLALLWLYALILGGVGVLIGREAVLWPIPDVPEPSDLARYGHINLPDADNAMVLYQQAGARLDRQVARFQSIPDLKGGGRTWNWTEFDQRLQPWIDANRPALDLWLAGTQRPDALLVQPDQVDPQAKPTMIYDNLLLLDQLATLEATRRQEAGDLAGALTYHLGVIRSSFHSSRHQLGSSGLWLWVQRQWRPTMGSWMNHPQMTTSLLRQAIAAMNGCLALRPSEADLTRLDYFALRNTLTNNANKWAETFIDQNQWYQHVPGVPGFTVWLRNEPKRSLKLLRLITAGQLAQCDRPHLNRPPLVDRDLGIYAIDATTPPPLARIKPEQLGEWVRNSNDRFLPNGPVANRLGILGLVEQFDRLRQFLAERAYSLDHDNKPPLTHGDLVPAYLDELPPTTQPGDPL